MEKKSTFEPTFTNAAATENNRTANPPCTYADCLSGRASMPQSPAAKSVFRVLMVGGMVTCMVTFNGFLHSGLAFFANAHWMYPLVFCIAYLVRTFIGDTVVGFVAPRLVFPHFTGVARSVAMTLLNVSIMGTIMGAIVTMLLNGPSGYLAQLATQLPLSMGAAYLINFFLVGPAVKMLFNNVVEPVWGTRMWQAAHRYVMSVAALFTS